MSNPLRAFWNGLIRAEHRLERVIGLHPAPDAPEGVEQVATALPSSASTPAATMTLAPRAGNPATAARIVRLAALLVRFWPELSGEPGPMPPQALELALAQAGLETVYGGGWSDKSASGGGDMRNSGNVGARQCSTGDTKAGAGPWHCVEYGDHNADGSSFAAKFRFFENGQGRTAEENGVYYFLKDLLKTWPVKAELLSGDAGKYSHRLGPDKAHGGLGYYGGFGSSMAEREGSYVKAIASRLPEVAAALGHDKVHVRVPVLGEGKFYTPTSDVHIAGVTDEWLAEMGRALVRGEHAAERWLRLRHDADNDTSPLAAVLPMHSGAPHVSTASSAPGLSVRRKEAVEVIVPEVVESHYGDAKFKKLAPGYHVEGEGEDARAFEGSTELGRTFSTCGYLPGYLGSRLGLAKNLSSYGTNGLRDNAMAWHAWITPGEGREPKPGDAYAIAGKDGGIVHVGLFIRKNPDGSWRTADAGQGKGPRNQAALYVDRPYDAKAHTLGGPMGQRPVAGWADLDLVPLAHDPHMAGIDRDRAPADVLAAVLEIA